MERIESLSDCKQLVELPTLSFTLEAADKLGLTRPSEIASAPDRRFLIFASSISKILLDMPKIQ